MSDLIVWAILTWDPMSNGFGCRCLALDVNGLLRNEETPTRGVKHALRG